MVENKTNKEKKKNTRVGPLGGALFLNKMYDEVNSIFYCFWGRDIITNVMQSEILLDL